MTVAQLIAFLQTQDQTLQVGYCNHSEMCLLEAGTVTVETAGVARPDGWIHDARPDKPTQQYLIFPGN